MEGGELSGVRMTKCSKGDQHNTLTSMQSSLHGLAQLAHLGVASHCNNCVTDFHQGLIGARSLQPIVQDFILLSWLISP